MKWLPLWLCVALMTALGGCSSTPKGPYGYTDHYLDGLEALEGAGGSVLPDRQTLSRFIAFYNPLEAQHIQDNIDQIYARNLYFNDTLVTLRNREALREHLLATANRLEAFSLQVRDCLFHNNEVFLVWIMEAQFSVLGQARLSRTIGISQLRFNARGQVIFQQDFWDSSQGLDQHLPIIGPPTRWLRDH